MKKYFWGIGTVIVLILLAGVIFIFSGVYNVAADVPHWKLTFLILEEVRDISISRRSRDINATLPQEQSAIDVGFKHYHEMCRLCHGGPGIHRTEFAEGLYPVPPSLDSLEMQEKLGRAGILWVVRHGLKMTGMPAFENTHTDEQIRSIVAFVERLPDMSPEKYMEMVSKEEKGDHGMHDHGMGQENGSMGDNMNDHEAVRASFWHAHSGLRNAWQNRGG